MTVRELVNELTQSYVDWDKEVFVCTTEEPVTNETSEYKRYSINRCSLLKPDWYLGDECILVIGKTKKLV